MRASDFVGCQGFPCSDVQHESYVVPDADVKPEDISIVLISETAPVTPADYYYAPGNPLFEQTTVQAFRDAGANVTSVQDILRLGVYLTTAVKCGKTGYSVERITIQECSRILEHELSLFAHAKAYLLMGDVAIQAVNTIARRSGAARVIPAGATYKIRGREYFFRGARAFPSYLQAGPSFFIEKTKRAMIAEDIHAALKLTGT
jgi:uracil-DNA glycosylase